MCECECVYGIQLVSGRHHHRVWAVKTVTRFSLISIIRSGKNYNSRAIYSVWMEAYKAGAIHLIKMMVFGFLNRFSAAHFNSFSFWPLKNMLTNSIRIAVTLSLSLPRTSLLFTDCVRNILNVLLWLLYCFSTACIARHSAAHIKFFIHFIVDENKIKWTTASKFLKQSNRHERFISGKLAAHCVCAGSWKKAGSTFHFS